MGKNNSNEHEIQFLGRLNEVQARQLAGLKAIKFGWTESRKSENLQVGIIKR